MPARRVHIHSNLQALHLKNYKAPKLIYEHFGLVVKHLLEVREELFGWCVCLNLLANKINQTLFFFADKFLDLSVDPRADFFGYKFLEELLTQMASRS